MDFSECINCISNYLNRGDQLMKTKKWFCKLNDMVLRNRHLYTKHGAMKQALDNRAKDDNLEVLFIETS